MDRGVIVVLPPRRRGTVSEHEPVSASGKNNPQVPQRPVRGQGGFLPVKPGKVGIYSCGPALHSAKQVATYRHLIMADLLKRYLRHRGFEVRQVLNLVDLDDRTIRASAEAGRTLPSLPKLFSKNSWPTATPWALTGRTSTPGPRPISRI